MNWDQLQYLAFYGMLHSGSITVITEYLKQVFKISDIWQRWVPLFISLPTTFIFLPMAFRSVGAALTFEVHEVVGTCLFFSVLAVGGSTFIYNVGRLLKTDFINALRLRMASFIGVKLPKKEDES